MWITNTVLLHFVLLIFRLHKVTIKAQPMPNRPLHILALLFLCFIHFTLHDHWIHRLAIFLCKALTWQHWRVRWQCRLGNWQHFQLYVKWKTIQTMQALTATLCATPELTYNLLPHRCILQVEIIHMPLINKKKHKKTWQHKCTFLRQLLHLSSHFLIYSQLQHVYIAPESEKVRKIKIHRKATVKSENSQQQWRPFPVSALQSSLTAITVNA